MQENESVAVFVRVPAATKRELEAVAREHGRSVAGETRCAVDAWLDLHRRELLAAWRAQHRASFLREAQKHEETADAESS